MRIGGRITPHATPAYFLENLIPLCDEFVDRKSLSDRVFALVGEFLEGKDNRAVSSTVKKSLIILFALIIMYRSMLHVVRPFDYCSGSYNCVSFRFTCVRNNFYQ